MYGNRCYTPRGGWSHQPPVRLTRTLVFTSYTFLSYVQKIPKMPVGSVISYLSLFPRRQFELLSSVKNEFVPLKVLQYANETYLIGIDF